MRRARSAAGSQTSKLMCGEPTPATRQKPGSDLTVALGASGRAPGPPLRPPPGPPTAGPPPGPPTPGPPPGPPGPRPRPAGGTNSPGPTRRAEVIVVSGSVRADSPSHAAGAGDGPCASPVPSINRDTNRKQVETDFMAGAPPPLDRDARVETIERRCPSRVEREQPERLSPSPLSARKWRSSVDRKSSVRWRLARTTTDASASPIRRSAYRSMIRLAWLMSSDEKSSSW